MAFGNDYIDGYPTCNGTHASLYLAAGPGSPDSVTDCLGLTPTAIRVLGQPGAWRDGEWRGIDSGLIAQMNVWCLSTESTVESGDSLRHIDHLLGLLEGKDEALAALSGQGWRTEVRVFWDSKWGHGGPTLTPPTMARPGQLGLTLSYDVYFSDPNRQPEEVEGHPGMYIVGM